MKNEFQNLHERAVEIAGRFHNAESDLIDILQAIDTKRVFVRLGYGSLFDYALKALKLSEANASNFITVARKSKSVPALKAAVRSGEITVSKARKITSVLNTNNAEHWLKLAKTLPKPKLEKAVAKAAPQSVRQDRTKYVSENFLELRVSLSEKTMMKLRRAQNLACQKRKIAANLEDTLNELLDFYLERNDPVQKANRNLHKNSLKYKEPIIGRAISTHQNDTAASVPGTHRSGNRQLPAVTKHRVHLRDQGRCTHVNFEGNRCENERWLEVHHQIPVAKGGENSLENLKTLCSVHHKYQHLN